MATMTELTGFWATEEVADPSFCPADQLRYAAAVLLAAADKADEMQTVQTVEEKK